MGPLAVGLILSKRLCPPTALLLLCESIEIVSEITLQTDERCTRRSKVDFTVD